MKQIFKKFNISGSSSDAEDPKILKNWFEDRNQWLVVQRNILFVMLLLSFLGILFLTFSVSFIKNIKSIEPFVIEIEPKTGVATVVEPLSTVVYTADEAVKRYFVWQYIKAREEYFAPTFAKAYKDIGLMSSPEVYAQYKEANNTANLQSPFNQYGQGSYRYINLKSMIFREDNMVEIRLRSTVAGLKAMTSDKIVLLQFKVNNLQMSEEKRLVNPLGFMVTLYRVDEERI